MFDRIRGWWQLWMALAVIWTFAVAAFAWIELPRARHMPHDPDYLGKLSIEASSILRGSQAAAEPVRGVLVWSDMPRFVRMYNGTRLAFPATTTDARAALVADEYRQLLTAEACQRRWPYLVEMLMLWLAPLLLAALAISGTARKTGGKTADTHAVHPVAVQF